MQPRLEETRSPSTTVTPAGGRLVRLDVRDLVQRWRARAKEDHGLAIVADDTSPTGTAFTLVQGQGARLEIYLK
jgi:hypothetical protein